MFEYSALALTPGFEGDGEFFFSNYSTFKLTKAAFRDIVLKRRNVESSRMLCRAEGMSFLEEPSMSGHDESIAPCISINFQSSQFNILNERKLQPTVSMHFEFMVVKYDTRVSTMCVVFVFPVLTNVFR